MTTSFATSVTKWFAAILLALLTTGCASTFNSKVTTFHDWSTGAAPGERTYQFAPSAEQANNLEYKNYEDLMRLELGAWGFTEAINSKPKFLVNFNYKVNSKIVQVRDTVPDPFPYYYGGGWGYGYGYGYRGRRPFYMYPPMMTYRTVIRDVQVYGKQLTVHIFDANEQNKPGKKRYEVTALNDSGNEDMVSAMPYLIRSALAEFPGNNGQVRDVQIELPKK